MHVEVGAGDHTEPQPGTKSVPNNIAHSGRHVCILLILMQRNNIAPQDMFI